MRIWHRLVGVFLLSEAMWYVYDTGVQHAFGDLQTAGLVLISGAVGVILVAKG
jgi:hypothetical protein